MLTRGHEKGQQDEDGEGTIDREQWRIAEGEEAEA